VFSFDCIRTAASFVNSVNFVRTSQILQIKKYCELVVAFLQAGQQIFLPLLYKGVSEIQPKETPFKFPGPAPSFYFSPLKILTYSWQAAEVCDIIFVKFSLFLAMGAISFMRTHNNSPSLIET
jgi:hypothetical protein